MSGMEEDLEMSYLLPSQVLCKVPLALLLPTAQFAHL